MKFLRKLSREGKENMAKNLKAGVLRRQKQMWNSVARLAN
jgi:hypothetical protein